MHFIESSLFAYMLHYSTILEVGFQIKIMSKQLTAIQFYASSYFCNFPKLSQWKYEIFHHRNPQINYFNNFLLNVSHKNVLKYFVGDKNALASVNNQVHNESPLPNLKSYGFNDCYEIDVWPIKDWTNIIIVNTGTERSQRANSVDLDQTAFKKQSDQGLHCLPTASNISHHPIVKSRFNLRMIMVIC